MSIKGTGQVIKALEDFNTRKRTARRMALTKIGLKIKGDSVRLTPVDTGNLRASAYIEVQGAESVRVGYTSAYAPFVHEMVEQKLKGQPRGDFGKTGDGEAFGGGSGKGAYWDTGEPKFLEKAMKNNRRFVLQTLAKALKV